MKKIKFLTVLAVLTLMSIPAQAACGRTAYPEGAQWKIFYSYPSAWRNATWRNTPDTDAPCNAPWCNIPDVTPAVPDDVPDATPDNTSPVPDAPDVPDVTPTVPATSNGDASMSAYETEVVRLVNAVRAQYGLSALTADGELSRVARYKSQDMRDKGYFSHTSPTYGSPFDMMKSFGISYRTAGENIAYGYSTPEKVVDAWMNSEGHRANILNASYTRIGVGYVASGHYWTQMFIG